MASKKWHPWAGFLPEGSIVMTKANVQSCKVAPKNTQAKVVKTKATTDQKKSADSLATISKELIECKRCKLCKERTNIVVGEGNPRARLVFVGEGPGRDEDLQGRPFVGRAGQLLDKMIGAIGLKREDVYICNVVKCRPPQNRNPELDEITACREYLERQLDVIKPQVIMALGKFAAQTLLETETPISKLRGEFFEYRKSKFIPTFHPAYLLRNSSGKKDVWEDLKKVAKELGLTIPKAKAKAE